uniref:Uncharacterized protein n=1 Tax=Strongyloides papillosus TaxID=174720 RepID=A0A0N5C892_STREA
MLQNLIHDCGCIYKDKLKALFNKDKAIFVRNLICDFYALIIFKYLLDYNSFIEEFIIIKNNALIVVLMKAIV